MQNGQKEWRTHLQCNDKHVAQSLRSPLKAALAAVAQHVGGVLPAHVSYSLPHAATVQNWLWASGGHPMTGKRFENERSEGSSGLLGSFLWYRSGLFQCRFRNR